MYARIRYPCFCIETCKYKTHMLDDLFVFVFLNKQCLVHPFSRVSLGIKLKFVKISQVGKDDVLSMENCYCLLC